MTLREKFSNLLPWYNEQDNKNKSEVCEKIVDDFTISFTNWKDAKYYFDGYYIQLSNNFRTNYKIEELLEIYKKESGL